MKQYIIRLALFIAALVALPTSDTNAQTQAEMNRQAAKDFHKADTELNSTYAALMAKLPDAESKPKLRKSASVDRIPRCRGGICGRPVSRWLGSSGATLDQHDGDDRAAHQAVESRFSKWLNKVKQRQTGISA